MPAAPLSEAAIAAGLQQHGQWSRQGEAIGRTIKCKGFQEAIDLVNAVAKLAEAANHHPDIDIRYNTLTFALSTHDSGGLTALDFRLAGEIDALAGQANA